MPDNRRDNKGKPVGPGLPELDYQSQNIILNVFNYLKNHRDYQHECIQDLEIRTARATKVSVSQVKRIRRLGKDSATGVIEPSANKRLAPILDTVDDNWKESLRREILAFQDRGELPTIDKLLERVKKPPLSFKGGRSSLHKLITDLGFKYEHSSSNASVAESDKDLEGNLNCNGSMNWIICESSAEKEFFSEHCSSENSSVVIEDIKEEYFEDTEIYSSSEDEALTPPPETGASTPPPETGVSTQFSETEVQSTASSVQSASSLSTSRQEGSSSPSSIQQSDQSVKKHTTYIDVRKSLHEQSKSLKKVSAATSEKNEMMRILMNSSPKLSKNISEIQKQNRKVHKSYCSHMQSQNSRLKQQIRQQRIEFSQMFENWEMDWEQRHKESQTLKQKMDGIQQQLVGIHKTREEQHIKEVDNMR